MIKVFLISAKLLLVGWSLVFFLVAGWGYLYFAATARGMLRPELLQELRRRIWSFVRGVLYRGGVGCFQIEGVAYLGNYHAFCSIVLYLLD